MKTISISISITISINTIITIIVNIINANINTNNSRFHSCKGTRRKGKKGRDKREGKGIR